MKLSIWTALTLSFVLSACATQNIDPTDTSTSTPLLTVKSDSDLNRASTVEKKEIFIKVLVSPEKSVRVKNDVKVDTEGSGQIKISNDDVLYAAATKTHGTIYCGLKNLHANATKTIVNQACVGDVNGDELIDSFLVRTGANHKDVPGFVLYDSEIQQLAAPADFTPFSVEPIASVDDKFELGFRLVNIKKAKGGKTAIFGILAKRLDDSKWAHFPTRDPIQVFMPTGVDNVELNTPVFSADLSNITLKSVDIEVLSVPSKTQFTYKRSLENTVGKGLMPAYQASGYNN